MESILKFLLCYLPTLEDHHCYSASAQKITRRGLNVSCRSVDGCCWSIGCLCTAWWFLLLLHSLLPSASPAPEPPGAKLKREGLQARHPVVFVPGIFSGDLELWQGKPCAEGLFRQRLWGGGFDDISKRPKCWMEHMALDNETGLDPPGVRVRPVPGLAAAGYFTWLIENLAQIGYEGKNMYMAAYDWRLSFHNTEVRDQSLSRLKSKIELLVRTSGSRKVVVVPYSTGALYFLHFLNWVEAPPPMGGGGGPKWCSQHIKAIMNVGPVFLGVPNSMGRIFSDEAIEIDYVIRDRSHGVLDPNILGFQALHNIMHVSQTWDSIHYLLPKCGSAIWGASDGSMQEGFDCELRNMRTARSLSSNDTGPENYVSDGKIGSWVSMMARYARILFFGKIISSSSMELPFADSKKIPLDSTFLQMISSLEDIKPGNDKINDGLSTDAKSRAYIYRMIHELLVPKMIHHASSHFSDGTADDLHDNRYSRYKYWSNPLEMKLPDAPDIEIYCLYGVDMPTDKSDNNKPTPLDGVHYASGDESLPKVSAGFMCARGWRGLTRVNPSCMHAYEREYTHTSPADLLGLKSNARANIMANSALIEDIMWVAAGASGDQIRSDILVKSDSVKLNVGKFGSRHRT